MHIIEMLKQDTTTVSQINNANVRHEALRAIASELMERVYNDVRFKGSVRTWFRDGGTVWSADVEGLTIRIYRIDEQRYCEISYDEPTETNSYS